jgi:hypothetical protein
LFVCLFVIVRAKYIPVYTLPLLSIVQVSRYSSINLEKLSINCRRIAAAAGAGSYRIVDPTASWRRRHNKQEQ